MHSRAEITVRSGFVTILRRNIPARAAAFSAWRGWSRRGRGL